MKGLSDFITRVIARLRKAARPCPHGVPYLVLCDACLADAMYAEAREKKCMWEILVPTAKENGEPISLKHHQDWDAKVLAITGGLTVCLPTVGQWASPAGTLFVERMIPVRIACSIEEIEKIADLMAAHYDQQSVMYYRVSEQVVIKRYEVSNR